MGRLGLNVMWEVSHKRLFSRNLGQNGEGYLQEIGFEEFLTILAFFTLPKQHTSEEEKQNIMKEKLRCENAFQTN